MTEPSDDPAGLANGLARLLRPSSVAIVGASDDPTSIGGAPVAMLERFGYRGQVHLVSKTRRTIGSRRCVASIDELPDGVDAAVLAIPRPGLLDAIEAAGRRHVGGAVVFASGYGEVGQDGQLAERELAEAARRHNLALAGPNCLGFVNFLDRAPLTFAHIVPNHAPLRRGIAVIAQSGALSMALSYAALAQHTFVTHAISTGNEAVLGIEDYLSVILEDEGTAAVALLVEQIRQPARFVALARAAAERSMLVCVLHTGRSARGRRASLTHTGALAGDQAVVRAALGREGVVFIDSLDGLIDVAGAFARSGAPRARGLGFMTDSGAAKTHAIDLAHELGVTLAELSAPTSERLCAELPPFATAENPVDITAMGLNDPSLYARVADTLLSDPAVGTLMIAAMPGSDLQGAEQIGALAPVLASADKPVIYTIMGGDWPLPAANVALLHDAGVLLLRSLERGVHVASALARIGERRDRRAPRDAADTLTVAPARVYHEAPAKALLGQLGLRVPTGRVVTSSDEAVAVASELGLPVVLKVSAPGLLHKSEVGGVVVVEHGARLAEAYASVLARVGAARADLSIEGVLVESMAPPGVEMIIGARRDPAFGPYLVIGAGGLWTEQLGDRAVLMADADEDEIVEALRSLRVFAQLSGLRDNKPSDLGALMDTIARLGALMRATTAVGEVEVNPLLVLPEGEGTLVLDALIIGADVAVPGAPSG
ncbi:MAG: acetate--CoA ligase family protein [Actinomycetota bacterium]|nr:acetate--CoA ligase family protein [Actinomycetota bacterium]